MHNSGNDSTNCRNFERWVTNDADRYITKVSRVGKYVKDKVWLLRVKINSHEGKTEILQRAKMLKDIQSFKRIVIAPDMTSQQQAVDKELRLKL